MSQFRASWSRLVFRLLGFLAQPKRATQIRKRVQLTRRPYTYIYKAKGKKGLASFFIQCETGFGGARDARRSQGEQGACAGEMRWIV
jgi:hypothetical protein